MDVKASAGDADEASPPIAADGRRANSAPLRLNVTALRRAVAIRTWGGKGAGLPCDFCRVLIAADDVEYEVEAQLDGSTLMLRFHYRCHYAWTGGEEPLIAAEQRA